MYKIIGANQVEYGPISAEQLRQWITEGRVNAQTLAQAEGETGWRAISTFPEFASSFPAAAATPPSTPPGVPGAPQPAAFDSGRAVALSQMSGPAISLMVLGGLAIAGCLYGILTHILGMAAVTKDQLQPLEQQSPQAAHFIEWLAGPMGIATNLVAMALWAFVIFSAVKMKKLESYGLCIAGCIVAMLPCGGCCCCIGIPIAIWALIMLNKADIKRYFT
ncbi:MAG TPA: DUF4339 domain-containing protein [Verrucomicrobiae bacterium]|nr:DUF4339 domain-containing protein [Verrucomicrobiae bacterium]